jgi:hypothetical protein
MALRAIAARVSTDLEVGGSPREPTYDLVGVVERRQHAGVLAAQVIGVRLVGPELALHGPEDRLLVLMRFDVVGVESGLARARLPGQT